MWVTHRLIYRCNLESIQRRYGLSVQEKVIEICNSMDEHGLEDWRLVSNISRPKFSTNFVLTSVTFVNTDVV